MHRKVSAELVANSVYFELSTKNAKFR